MASSGFGNAGSAAELTPSAQAGVMAMDSVAHRLSAVGAGAALELRGVTRMFGALAALTDVTITVRPGVRRAVLGSNGAGKTTLFNCITGDFPPSSGTIRFFGEDITHFPPYERIRRGLRRTYQISALFPGLTVLDNVYLACCGVSRGRFSPLRPRPNDALMHSAELLIQAVHLTPVKQQRVSELAHGQQRQLEIALALEVRGLDVYYGHSHALQGVDLTLESGVFSVIGRNGMGKTTLCKTIMGLLRASGGSVRVRGQDITSMSPAGIARLGVGYVPQGRRLWRSLSVDEHLRLAAGIRRGPWSVERIYETFPRLAERKNHGGGQLSGGEQQMLAISRALLTNPQLLVMDEPTEGLAPVIVAQVEEMLVRLGDEGDISVLVIEQNIGVATAISRNVAVMVNGRVNRIIDSVRLAADRDLQQRLLGVGLHAGLEPEVDVPTAGPGTKAA